MDRFYEFGKQFGEFLKGFNDASGSTQITEHTQALSGLTNVTTVKVGENRKALWGKLVETRDLPELFKGELAPKRHVRSEHPEAGIDHMKLKTVDVFRIPGMGEYKVNFEGYFKVSRSKPSTNNWETATVYVNFLDLKLLGFHEELGEIIVDLNPEVVSAGNTFPSRDAGLVACRINVAARFHVKKLGLTLFNKTPIQLTNDDVKGIPTIGEGGPAIVNSLPLYKWDDPHGELFGFVEEIEYKVGDYATADETKIYKAAATIADLKR